MAQFLSTEAEPKLVRTTLLLILVMPTDSSSITNHGNYHPITKPESRPKSKK